MKCKTLDNRSPRDLARIYFCCYKADFDKFFTQIADELFSFQQNIAIYYYEPGEEVAVDDNYFFELSNMQLFVIPITTDFLTNASRAKDIELTFAKEKHIPILPLIQEPGLEALFNEKCGNIQCINKNALIEDVTAIPYEQKMTQFLSAVLVGDEMSQKILNNFAKKLFLSYRKKDRKFARDIMNAIHSIPAFWDLAIWYDEFLVPGEDFDDSIKKQIAECVIFMLALTPNLLEQPNYVLEKEYPLAVELKKDILSIEAIPTDREELSKWFTKLKTILSLENHADIEEKMVNIVGKGADEDNCNAAHLFLMGLAYNSGIGTEVNHEKGIELITKAAEMHLPEAAKKLADIYTYGDGTEIFYPYAMEWQKKYCELLDAENDVSSIEYASAYMELANMCRKLMQYEDTRIYFEKALHYLDTLDEATMSDEEIHMKAGLCFGLAKIILDLSGKSDSAMEQMKKQSFHYFDCAKNLEIMLLEKEATVSRKIQLIETLNYYGRALYVLDEDMCEAAKILKHGFSLVNQLLETEKTSYIQEYYGATVRMSEALSDALGFEPAKAWGLFMLGEGTNILANYSSTGKWLSYSNKFDEAEKFYLEGVEYAEKHLKEHNSIALKIDLFYLIDDIVEFYHEYKRDKKLEQQWCAREVMLASELTASVGLDTFGNIVKHRCEGADE